jgi:hypothetical protein
MGDDGTQRVAVTGVAVQGLGMQHELPAFGRVAGVALCSQTRKVPGRCLCRCTPLRGVHRIDLGTALTPLADNKVNGRSTGL